MTTPEQTQTNLEGNLEGIASKFIDLGVAWARTGLTMGRTALEASAQSLTVTAEALETLRKSLEADETEDAPKK